MANSVIDERTANRNYPKPHIQNDGDKDVERLRLALNKLDSDMQNVMNQADALQASKTDKTLSDAQQNQVDILSALVYSTL